jgi:hypothetical protein
LPEHVGWQRTGSAKCKNKPTASIASDGLGRRAKDLERARLRMPKTQKQTHRETSLSDGPDPRECELTCDREQYVFAKNKAN